MQIAGHLQEKRGYYYAVLSYNDESGKRKTKWISTKLPVKGNKKKAEMFLSEARQNFIVPQTMSVVKDKTSNILFADFLTEYLEVAKQNITLNTYSGYHYNLKVIVPYFNERGITLAKLQPKDIQDFYTAQLKRVKANSVIHYHTFIRKALCYAVKMDMIPLNPIYKVEKPKKNSFIGSFYDNEEVNKLFEIVSGTNMEIPVLLGGFYGMRRGEIIGLRWSSINFESDTITINHTIVTPLIDGKKMIISEDRAKNKSSLRTLPLVLPVKNKLLELKARQEEYRKKFKKSYNKEYIDYICLMN